MLDLRRRRATAVATAGRHHRMLPRRAASVRRHSARLYAPASAKGHCVRSPSSRHSKPTPSFRASSRPARPCAIRQPTYARRSTPCGAAAGKAGWRRRAPGSTVSSAYHRRRAATGFVVLAAATTCSGAVSVSGAARPLRWSRCGMRSKRTSRVCRAAVGRGRGRASGADAVAIVPNYCGCCFTYYTLGEGTPSTSPTQEAGAP